MISPVALLWYLVDGNIGKWVGSFVVLGIDPGTSRRLFKELRRELGL